MRQILAVLIAIGMVSGCSSMPSSGSTQGQFPVGAYKIRSAQVDYRPDMTYKIYDSKQVFVEGRYEINGNVITMTDVGGKFGCKENPARYHWSSTGSSVKYDLIEDKCEARKQAMAESPFAKIEQ